VAHGLKLFSVELNSLILFELGEGEFDDDGDDPRKSCRFSDLLIAVLGGERLQLLKRGLTFILSKRFIPLGGALRLTLCQLGRGAGSRPRRVGRDGERGPRRSERG